MNFYKALKFSTIYSASSILSTIFIVKITSKLIGPVGTAYFSQFSNFISIINILTVSAITTGLIKYIAEFKDDQIMLKKYMSNAAKMVFILSIMCSVTVLTFYGFFAKAIFFEYKYASIVIIYAVLILFNSFNYFMDAVLNGYLQIKYLTIINMIVIILNFIIIFFLAYKYLIWGCLLATCISILIKTITYYFYLRKAKYIHFSLFKDKLDLKIIFRILKFSLLQINTVFYYLILNYIRTHLNNKFGTEQAGLWSGMVKISDLYLAFILNTLSTYYYPKLTEYQKNYTLLLSEMRKAFKRILPLVFLCCFFLFLFRDFFIKTFLSTQFIPMRHLFLPQFIGDFLAVFGWFFHIQLIIKDKIKLYTFVAISGYIVYLIAAYFLIDWMHLVGTNWAFAIFNLWCVLFSLYLNRKLVNDIIHFKEKIKTRFSFKEFISIFAKNK